jgi:hypothetical protein
MGPGMLLRLLHEVKGILLEIVVLIELGVFAVVLDGHGDRLNMITLFSHFITF